VLNLLCQRPARCYARLLLSASACSTASVAIDRYLLQTPALSIKHAADRRDRQTNGRTPNRYINAKQRQQMSQEPFVLHLFYFILDVRACLKPGLRVGCPYVAMVTHRLAAPFIYIRRPRFRDTDIQLLLPVFSPLLLCCLSLIYPVMDKS